MTNAEMKVLCKQDQKKLTGEETLVFHFNAMGVLEPILQGRLRASRRGQGGGGVSVVTKSPAELGWENGAGDFRENVGKALWGEKFKDVMVGWEDKDKLDALLFLRVPTAWLAVSIEVPGRDDMHILQSVNLKEKGGEYYLDDKVIKVCILKPQMD